jgi:hypothetical protein
MVRSIQVLPAILHLQHGRLNRCRGVGKEFSDAVMLGTHPSGRTVLKTRLRKTSRSVGWRSQYTPMLSTTTAQLNSAFWDFGGHVADQEYPVIPQPVHVDNSSANS